MTSGSPDASALRIRPERSEDAAAVFEVVRLAFRQDAEARLVDRLRDTVEAQVSLVAEEADAVVGHILFTPVSVHSPQGESTAMGLAPLAVVPHRQRSGVGGALVRAGLDACLALGEAVVFVLGHRGYYPRFGFEPALDRGLFYRNEEASASFFVAELAPDALGGRTGEVRYHPAFDAE